MCTVPSFIVQIVLQFQMANAKCFTRFDFDQQCIVYQEIGHSCNWTHRFNDKIKREMECDVL